MIGVAFFGVCEGHCLEVKSVENLNNIVWYRNLVGAGAGISGLRVSTLGMSG